MDVCYDMNRLHHTDLLKQAEMNRLAKQVKPAARRWTFRLPGWLKWPVMPGWTQPAAPAAVLCTCCDA